MIFLLCHVEAQEENENRPLCPPSLRPACGWRRTVMGHMQPFHLPKAWRGPHCGDRKASELPLTLQLLPRLPPKPMTTEPLNSTPFCGPSLPPLWPPWWGLHHLPSPPAHTCPCGCLQVSPSPVGFDHAFLLSLLSWSPCLPWQDQTLWPGSGGLWQRWLCVHLTFFLSLLWTQLDYTSQLPLQLGVAM